jgi:hypothetical protein
MAAWADMNATRTSSAADVKENILIGVMHGRGQWPCRV